MRVVDSCGALDTVSVLGVLGALGGTYAVEGDCTGKIGRNGFLCQQRAVKKTEQPLH